MIFYNQPFTFKTYVNSLKIVIPFLSSLSLHFCWKTNHSLNFSHSVISYLPDVTCLFQTFVFSSQIFFLMISRVKYIIKFRNIKKKHLLVQIHWNVLFSLTNLHVSISVGTKALKKKKTLGSVRFCIGTCSCLSRSSFWYVLIRVLRIKLVMSYYILKLSYAEDALRRFTLFLLYPSLLLVFAVYECGCGGCWRGARL